MPKEKTEATENEKNEKKKKKMREIKKKKSLREFTSYLTLMLVIFFLVEFENGDIKKTTIKKFPPLKIQELVDTLATSSSGQVSLSDKCKGKIRILEASQGKLSISITLFSLKKNEENVSLPESHFFEKKICSLWWKDVECCNQALVEVTCANHCDDSLEFNIFTNNVHISNEFKKN